MVAENYVSFEVAKLLKEKGFNEECNTVYSEYGELHEIFDKEFYESTNAFVTLSNSNYNDITRVKYRFFVTAPTLQRAMKWLREVHGIFIAINIVPNTTVTMEQRYYFFKPYKNRRIYNFPLDYSVQFYETYEKTCESAIRYCLENLI